LLSHVTPHSPSVLAGDLNTWFLGRWEPAHRRVARTFPETRLTTTPFGHRARGRLDALFYRLPPPAASRTWVPRDPCGTRDARCGSDHRPIIGVTSLGTPRSSSSDAFSNRPLPSVSSPGLVPASAGAAWLRNSAPTDRQPHECAWGRS
jgi:hypothetical protein